MRNTVWALITSIMFMIAGTNVFASEFKDGYIITLQMDTVYGQICNGTYMENSLECRFQRNPSEPLKSYTPDELFGYRFIDGKYYVSKFVFQEKRTVFLEYLVKGNLDVYFQQCKDSENRFYVAKDTLPLRLLKYEEKEVYIDGRRFLQLNNTSYGVLEYYTNDCPELVSVIRKMKKPEHKKMIKFATEYHHKICPEGTCQVFEKKMPSKIMLTASLGVGCFPLPIKGGFNPYESEVPKTYFSNAASVLFQQPWVSESSYFGIGYADYFRIPLSFYYIPDGKGLLPITGYEIDISDWALSQNLTAGIRLPYKKWSFMLTGNLTTAMFFSPVACSVRLGLMYQLR